MQFIFFIDGAQFRSERQDGKNKGSSHCNLLWTERVCFFTQMTYNTFAFYFGECYFRMWYAGIKTVLRFTLYSIRTCSPLSTGYKFKASHWKIPLGIFQLALLYNIVSKNIVNHPTRQMSLFEDKWVNLNSRQMS